MTIELTGFLLEYDKVPSMEFTELDYSFMRDEALEALDITTESESNNKALRAVAKMKYWERVVALTSADFDFSTKGESFSRSQVNKMAKENLLLAEQDASQYLSDYEAEVGGWTMIPDPYTHDEDRENML